eukprot:5817077-Ditylum_brightwellii.AAC.1
MEEMFIACVYPVVKSYQLKGGTVDCKVDSLYIEQDIGGVAYLLQANNPLYVDININFDQLSQLPEDNSVEEQVNVVEEEELGQEAQHFLTAAREINVTPIQFTVGPEQGGASGVNNPDEDQINEGYIAALLIPNIQTENEQLCQIFNT